MQNIRCMTALGNAGDWPQHTRASPNKIPIASFSDPWKSEGCQAILMSNTGLQKVEEGNLEETTVAVLKILTPPVNWSKFQTSGPHPTGDGVYEGSRCKQFTRRPVQNLTHVLSKLGHNCVQKCPHCQDWGFNLSSLVTGQQHYFHFLLSK